MRTPRLLLAASAVIAVTFSLAAAPAWAASDSTATITGSQQGPIQGDGINAKGAPSGAIVVAAVGFGLDVPVTGPGGVAGRPVTKPFTLVKMPDKASPKLLRAAFTGEHLTVDIAWFMTDPLVGRKKTFSITLEGAVIIGMDSSGTVLADGGVSEALSLSYAKITFRDERSVPAITVCLDVANGQAC
jgi:type VI secretion system Hcp family effector